MKKEVNKVDFDLSTLSLQELIELYNELAEFLAYLNDKRIDMEEKVEEDE